VPSKPPTEPDRPDIPPKLDRVPADVALDRLEFDCALVEAADFSGQRASSLRFDECRLDRVDFTGADLTAAVLQDVVVEAGSWSNARTTDLRIRRSAFDGVRMTGADLAGSILEDVVFVDCRLDLAFFVTARLSRVRFERCRLDEVDFSEALLSSVAFVGCTLRGSVWADTSLTDCELRGSDIAGAVHIERLRGARMPVADVLAAATDLAAGLGIEVVD
jgi:uncharacterized protein YjbI with pentapeptide repeats